MTKMTITTLLFLSVAPAFAQNPTITGLHVRADVAVATGVAGGGSMASMGTTTTGAITTGSEMSMAQSTTNATAGSAMTVTGKKSPCASSPYTADGAIFSVLLVLEPQIDGLTKFRNVNGAMADQKTPQTVYFMTSTPIQLTSLRTQRREYAVTNKYINELWIENLSWADASDILSELQATPALVTGPIADAIRAAGGLSYSFVAVTLPIPSGGRRPDVDLTDKLAEQGSNYRPDRWARTIDTLSKMTSFDGEPVTPKNVTITASSNAQVTVEATPAATNLAAIIGAVGTNGGTASVGAATGTNGGTASAAGAGAVPVGRILLVDAPCLTVALLPALTGSNVTGGTLQFSGRYLFPWQQGHSFARLGISGESPLNSGSSVSSLSKFGAVFDLAFNKDRQPDAATAPVRFTGGLTTTFDHSTAAGGGMTMSKAAGGAKGSISFPNFTPCSWATTLAPR